MSRTCLFHVSGNRYFPFPAQHHTRRIWGELAKGFDEYHVIARGMNNRYTHTVDGNIHLHLLPSLGSRMWPFLFLSWTLPIFFFCYRPTHMVVQCPVMGGIPSSICSWLFRVPLFLELHGAHYFYPAKEGWTGRLEHYFYRYFSMPAIKMASRIRSLSEDMSDHILGVYGKKAYEKSIVVPNRVDLNVFQFAKQDYSRTGPLKLISVGSFYSGKNHCRLIEDLARTGIDVHLILVGAGPLKDEYIDLASRLNFGDRLEIFENISHDRLAALLVEQDIYVHYSHSEAVSRAILESMAVALPVVATRVGFIKGILDDLKNSIVIDRPYEKGLVAAVTALGESEALRQKLGSAARRDVEDRYEWNQVFGLYRDAILSMD